MDHQRRTEIAEGAITSLKEKLELLGDAKKTKDLEIQLTRINSEIERHTKTSVMEKKVIATTTEKVRKNFLDYEEK